MTDATETFGIKLRIIAEKGMFTAEVSLSEVGVSVVATAADLNDAIRTAATECAAELRKKDYATTPAEVVEALTEALDQHLAEAN